MSCKTDNQRSAAQQECGYEGQLVHRQPVELAGRPQAVAQEEVNHDREHSHDRNRRLERQAWA
jgi:hypothetical protein